MAQYQGNNTPLILTWKVVHMEKPMHIFNKIRVNEEFMIDYTEPRLQFTDRGFRHRTSQNWNALDQDQDNKSISQFKRRLKTWVKEGS